MNPRFRFLGLVLLAAGAATVSHARLGENLAELKKRFGTPAQQVQPRKDQEFWLFEGDDGQLMYTVTFNAKGQSIAEGLKPLKRARFNRDVAMNFIDSELVPIRSSKTLRTLQPGDVYHFAGQNLVCGDKEFIMIDEAHGTLVIWSQAGIPSVMVLAPEMMAQMN